MTALLPEITPVASNEVPAGYRIEYFLEEIRELKDGTRKVYDKRHYKIDGVEVPSVTTILGCLDKPALPWWGMKVGIEGVLELYRSGVLFAATHPVENVPALAYSLNEQGFVAGVDPIVDLLTVNQLTTNHVRDTAAVRGQNAHDAFEAWCAVGQMPDPEAYPEEERGYVRALVAFINDTAGGLEPVDQEVIVGSKEHGFAGRYDFRGRTTKEMRLVTSALTTKGEIRKKGPKYTVVPAGISLLADVKTSKGIYGSHLLQLEGYEGGSVECGYPATDARAVIHLTNLGVYEFKRARATYEDFLAILQTYRALERVEEALKA